MKNYTMLRHLAEAKSEDGQTKLFPGVSKLTTYQIDPLIIEVEEGFNARPLDLEHIEALKISIKSGAYIPPIVIKVIDEKPFVRDGHHRLAAYSALISDGEEIKFIEVRDFQGNDADSIALMLTSAQGKPLTPLQQGIQYKKLINYGWTNGQIAERVGKSKAHIGQMIKLSGTDSEIQNLIDKKVISARSALDTVREHGKDATKVIKQASETAKQRGKGKVTKKILDNPKAGQIDLVSAIERERESNGLFRAEIMCEKHADLIAYLRGTAKTEPLNLEVA